MFFLIGIAAIAVFTLVIGVVAVVAYVKACSQLQLALRTRTSIRNSRQDLSVDEFLWTISDRRD